MIGYTILIHFDNDCNTSNNIYLVKETCQKEIDKLNSERTEIDFAYGVYYQLNKVNIITN